MISDTVKVGHGTPVIPPCYIVGNVVIGEDCIIGPFASIGSPPEHWEYYKKKSSRNGKIIIGDNTIIREFTTINAPMEKLTAVGSNCFLMRGSHVSHDTILCDDVTLSCGVKIGGHSFIDEGATLGLNSCVHQYSTIGTVSMIGMGGIITKDIPPFLVYKNYSCYKVNRVGMLRHNFTETDINEVEKYYRGGSSKVTSYIRRFNEIRNPRRKICPVHLS